MLCTNIKVLVILGIMSFKNMRKTFPDVWNENKLVLIAKTIIIKKPVLF